MNTPKPATRRPKFDHRFLAQIILEHWPAALGTKPREKDALDLAEAILTAMRSNLGSRGGRATKAKYGADHYSKIGKMGGRPKIEKPNGAEEK